MWVDTREKMPKRDGTYMVQTVYGEVCPLSYTTKNGWNTTNDDNGKYRVPDLYVARWFDMEEPSLVPKKWKEDYWYRKER